ncbi:thermonuclease family protein [Sphingomonas faeni]|uniref:thermonuclease family protein n=1 Tax=Sphingomonas faeni TaxID=185950 RepID=UPI00335B2740
MSDPWSQFQEVTPTAAPVAVAPPADEWAEFNEVKPTREARRVRGRYKSGPPVAADDMKATGQVHDGDTFRLNTGQNGRLYGADAFELDQTGKSKNGELIRLGQQARGRFASFADPAATILNTGASTYGRPVVSVENGGDAASALLRQGLAITTPEYLKADPVRLNTYMEDERDARLNRRGAWAGAFEQPSSYRHGTPDPWAKPVPGKEGESEAVFWDEQLPAQGVRPGIADEYIRIWQDPTSKPADLLAFAKTSGFTLDPSEVEKAYKGRETRGAGSEVTYRNPPRVLTDHKDGATGAALRGVADPFNVLDETGALADSLLPGDRENVWSSDRRFGDVYGNNLDQNRSILAFDDAKHPYARFGGQLVGGLIAPGASIEGVGFGAARSVLEAGGTRFAAEQAARRAVTARLGTAGMVEGAAAGIGQGEDWQGRIQGGLVGAPVGLGLGVGTGLLAPHIAKLIGRPFSGMAGTEAERSAQDLTDGALDAAKAGTQNGATPNSVGIAGDVAEDAATRSAGDLVPPAPAPAPRPRDPVEPNTPAMDEESGLGPKSVLSFVPRTGEPGVLVINEDGQLAIAVYRDSDGVARGAAQIPLTPEARETFDGASVYVAPELRRQGVASRLYNALEREGHPIGEQSGSGDLTPDGAGFVSSWRRAAPMENETQTPTIMGPADEWAEFTPVDGPAGPSAERLAQAEDVRSSDMLPLPSNAVGSLEEAEGIAAGRIAPVRAPNEADVLERRNIPNANTGTPMAKRGPLDLVTWLRSQGGIRAQGGELERYGIDNAPRKGVDFAGGENRFGPLVANEGMNYDDAAQRAWEAGFFPDHVERPTVAEFLDTLNATHTGNNRAFRTDDLAEVDAFEQARSQRYQVEAARQEGAPLVQDRGEPVTADDLDRNAPPVEAYEEWGENAPKLAGNIRLDKLDSPQSIARALANTHARVGGFDEATRGRITNAETKSLAEDLGMTADDLLKRRKGQAFNAEEALAARQILARSGADLVNMAKRLSRVENPGDELEAAFRGAWLRHAAIQEQVAGMTAEAGRLLQQFRMTADSRDANRVLSSLGDALGGPGRMKEVAERIVDLENVGVTPAGINKFALRSLLPKWRDKAIELYINSLLSGPQTHAVNILSNTLTSIAQLPEHAVAAGIGAIRKTLPGQAETERVLFSELGTRAAGMVSGAREGMKAAARSFLTGESDDAISKVEQQQANAIGGKLGTVIRTPTRLLSAEDELFKGIARRMELNGIAMRRARNEGLKGKAARDRAADLVLNPDDTMLRGSFEYARYLTFQTPLRHDSFAAGVSRATQGRPIAKLLLPFVRTPVNLLKFAAERSPAAVLMKSWKAEIQAGGARRDMAMARALVGTGMGAAMYEAAMGGHITGGGPADDSAKRLLQAGGWQPYSFKIGDRYYSYSRLDPFSTTIGTVADMVEMSSHMTEKQQEKSFTLVAAAIVNNLSSKTWMSGLSSALEAINDPDRYLDGFVSRTAGAIAVPSLVAQIAKSNDPLVREARAPMERIKSRIPGMSANLYPRRDVFGKAMTQQEALGPDLVSPLYSGRDKMDPTIKSLLDIGATVTKPQRTHKVGGKSIDWTPAQYDRLQDLTGGQAKPELDALVASQEWRKMDEDDQKAAVARVLKEARKDAKAIVLAGDTAKAAGVADGWREFTAVQ